MTKAICVLNMEMLNQVDYDMSMIRDLSDLLQKQNETVYTLSEIFSHRTRAEMIDRFLVIQKLTPALCYFIHALDTKLKALENNDGSQYQEDETDTAQK
ncbi:hypothetical protein [Liquorilactobacillus satsumensis]|uniref:hypothetical protein n=1 Tax=Liquorilactobacillus satsumensis TaxID=259059 RepID=UPI0039E8383D